jgi:xanthine dehydrogenase/oxidase
MAAGAKVTVGSAGGIRRVVSMSDDFIRGYRQTCLEPEEVIISVHLPATRPHEYVMAYKQSRRRDDDIAIASASYRTLFEQQDNALVVKEMYMSYGGMSKQTVRAKQTEEYLKGKPWTEETFKGALHYLEQDLPLEPNAPGGMILYRKTLTTSFFYKYFLFLQQELAGAVPESYKNILGSFHRELSHGNQYYHMNKQSSQVGYPEVHVAALKQVTGEAIYTDDIPQPLNGLYAAFVWSTKARAKILGIDPSEALKMDGVRDFLSARDIPGINQVGIVAHDEEIMASQVVPCVGFPVGLVVAKTLKIAQKAAKLVKVQYEDLPAIITIDQAIEAKSFYHPIHKLEHGAVDAAFKECDHVLEGEMRVGGQDHFYLETHNALAIPGEEDEMTIWSSTQNPNEAQLKAAEALGIPANRIVVKIKRMGGGFGGKESRSFTVSSAAAVAAAKLRCPVRICLERDEDMFSTGGRHPFMGRYKVGFTNTGKILALQVELFANGGHSLDLSMGVIDRALFHVTNTYRVPNVRAVGHICKTNTPSNTAFRGFGAPQSMIICETWLDRVAKHLNMSQTVVRDLNFIKSGDITYYGQTMEDCHNVRIWKELLEISKYEERLAQVKKFNETSRWKKRGVYCVPTQYGMSFTVKHLNQANAMVHVYMDGSVSVTHAGCEMGQGLHTKMIQIAANELGVPIDKIYIADTSTDRVANGAPTAASVTSDLNGMAVLLACRELRRTLEPLRRQLGGEATWQQIARAAWMERLPLTAHGHYATPDLHFDWQVGTGRPFNYYNHGAACSEVEVDVLTGDFQILRTDIVMDVGNSINPAIDVGQIEGAFVQGLGLFTLEEVVTFADGRMFTRGPSTYKIPGFKDIPLEFNVHLLKDVPNPRAVHSSKGVGEPPLFLAASVFFAIKDAVAAARNETQRPTWFPLNSPATCERIRMSSKDDFTKQFDPNDAPY